MCPVVEENVTRIPVEPKVCAPPVIETPVCTAVDVGVGVPP